MYQEILEIIFYYSANYRLPDKVFIEKIISYIDAESLIKMFNNITNNKCYKSFNNK